MPLKNRTATRRHPKDPKDTMATLDPDYITLDYRCQYRAIPSLDHGPSDFPMN
jgi:hypothetical protein